MLFHGYFTIILVPEELIIKSNSYFFGYCLNVRADNKLNKCGSRFCLPYFLFLLSQNKNKVVNSQDLNKQQQTILRSVEEKVQTAEMAREVPKSFLDNLKAKWQLDNLVQVVAVLAVFTLTGSTVVFIRKFLFASLGFDEATPFWLKTITYLLFVFPAYQVMLLGYGFLLGQFRFFWEKEKKLVKRMVRPFRKQVRS